MDMRTYFERLITDGGGEFIELRDNAVYFRKGPNEPVISLYPAALRSVHDVHLALKNAREKKQAQAWELPAVKDEHVGR